MESSKEFIIGDIVQHFKYETLSDTEKAQNKYLYRIEGIAEHTETGEPLIIYRALYTPFKLYARPFNMFYSKIDKFKYPNLKQEYRFEKHNF